MVVTQDRFYLVISCNKIIIGFHEISGVHKLCLMLLFSWKYGVRGHFSQMYTWKCQIQCIRDGLSISTSDFNAIWWLPSCRYHSYENETINDNKIKTQSAVMLTICLSFISPHPPLCQDQFSDEICNILPLMADCKKSLFYYLLCCHHKLLYSTKLIINSLGICSFTSCCHEHCEMVELPYLSKLASESISGFCKSDDLVNDYIATSCPTRRG